MTVESLGIQISSLWISDEPFPSHKNDPSPVEQEAEAFAEVLKALPANEYVYKSYYDEFRAPGLARPSVTLSGNISPLYVQCIQIDERRVENGKDIMCISALTEKGHTVMLTVYDYTQSFYIQTSGTAYDDMGYTELCSTIEDLANAWGTIRIGTWLRKSISKEGEMAILLEIPVRGAEAFRRCKEACKYHMGLPTFDGDIPNLLSFQRAIGIQADSWLKVGGRKYERLLPGDKISRCQIEVEVSHRDIHVLDHQEVEAIRLPEYVPRRTLSFDIETTLGPVGRDGKKAFPTPETSSIIQISNILTWADGSMRAIFTVGSCNPIEGVLVFSFDNERRLLSAWLNFVEAVDPDTLTGYNIGRFDLPFISGRVKKYDWSIESLGRFGEEYHMPSLLNWREPRSWEDAPLIPGRVTLDLFNNVCQLDLPSWHRRGLAAIAKRFLGENKISMDPQDIPTMQEGGPETRRILAIYCLKDSHLAMRLLEHMKFLRASVARARRLGIPVTWLMLASEQKLVRFQRFKEAFDLGYAVRD